MSITIDEMKSTEKLLAEYFQDIEVLRVWRANVRNRKEYKKRLETKLQEDIFAQFSDNVKSPVISQAAPTNRQPPKGIDSCIDKAGKIYENLLLELDITELDIITTEESLERLEQRTLLLSQVMELLDGEAKKILELKFRDGKSFEYIGDMTRRSKSAVHEFYKKIIFDVCKWLKSIDH